MKTVNNNMGKNYIQQFSVNNSSKKRTRTVMTSSQHKLLMEVFDTEQFPATDIREDLARRLRLPPRTLQIWFQNQRQKTKQGQYKKKNHEINSNEQDLVINEQYYRSKLDILADVAYFEYLEYLERSQLKKIKSMNKDSKNDHRPSNTF